MVHSALLIVALCASAHATAINAPLTFDSSVLSAMRQMTQVRAESVKKLDAGLAARLNWLAMDVRTHQQDTSRLRNDLARMRSRLVVIPGRPVDPNLAFDVRRMAQDFQQLARDLQWKLQDARGIRSAIQGKDPDMVGAASSFAGEVLWLSNETRWLDMDVRNISWDLRSMGFNFEAMDMEMAVRDIDSDVAGLKNESDLINAKIR